MTDTTFEMIWDGDRAAFAKAFIAAQQATEAVKKAATNPHFKSKYADLSEVVEATVPALNANGIGVIQSPGYDGDLVSVTTTLLHESGATCTGVLRMRPTKNDPQGVGSAVTYARRYSLLAMTGAAPEDDDGNAASAKPNTGAPKALTVQPEGPDWWGAEGPGLSSAEAKRQGWGDRFDKWRTAIPEIQTAAAWREWCAENADDIRRLPKGWRVMLREEAQVRGEELGAITADRRAAA